MTTEHRYEAIVIGAGQAGVPLARALASAGRKTALVEREHIGGTCINEGCTPTKTMVASARVAYLARRAADYGVRSGPVSVDLTRVRQRKRDIVESFRQGSQRRLEQTEGLDLMDGEARFTAPHTLTVQPSGGRPTLRLAADLIFINTGARPRMPPLPGLEQVSPLDSTSVMELDRVPEHLLVVGGGYIGLEFAQMFRRFGSRVTVVHRGRQLLAREDPDIAEEMRRILEDDGIRILLDAEPSAVAATGPGGVTLTVPIAGAGPETLEGSHLLIATGRTPNTDRLDLAVAGIATDRNGFVPVDPGLETAVPGVYALGDVKGGPAFTHISYDDFRIIRTNLLEGGSATTADRLVPYTVFTDPQLGRIGLTEEAARAEGRDLRIARMPMSHVARALEMDEPRGVLKVVVERGTELILGAAILGIEGGEMMAALQLAMMGRLPYPVLRDAVFAHPTLAEAFNNLFTAMDAE